METQERAESAHTVAKTIKRYSKFRYFLILEGAAIGIIVGLVIVAFRLALERGDLLLRAVLAYQKSHSWFIPVWFVVLAAGAAVVAALLKWESLISGSGIPQVEGEIMGKLDQTWWRVLAAKFAGGMVCLGCGLSLGREGPSIQLGAVMAKGFSRLTHRVKTEEKLLMTCGASAGLAAAFNAPIAGVLFSLEEIHKHFSPEVLLSTMAASVASDFVSRNVFGLKPVFTFELPYMMPLNLYGHALALGLLAGLLGVLYNTCIAKSLDLYQKLSRQTARLMVPFMAAGVLGLVYPITLGGGHSLVETLSTGEMMTGALLTLFAVKFIYSMVSFGSGAPGGIFLPLLVMGAVIGSAYCKTVGLIAPALADLTGNFVILGMTGFFSAIVRAPITGIILISEMSGSFSHLLTLSITALVAYLIPDIVKCAPVYDLLLHRMLSKKGEDNVVDLFGEKVLVESIIYHGSAAEGKQICEIPWPRTALVISLTRWEAELVPRGDTRLMAGDKLVVLCDEAMEGQVHQTLESTCQAVHL